jgi:ubiquitin
MCLITVNCHNGTTLTFDREPLRYVNQLKVLIQEKTEIPVEEQNIVSDSILNDEDPVREYMSHFSLIIGDIKRLIDVKIGTYTVTLNVSLHSCVGDLLSLLQKQVSYDTTHYSVYGNGEVLRKDLPVSAIGKFDIFLLPPLKQGELQIFIITLDGRKIPFAVSLEFTVNKLKQIVYDHEGIPPDQQRFIFAGRQFEDRKSLADYKILHGSFLHLVLRLRGGMHHQSSTGEGMSPLSEIYQKSVLVVKHEKGTDFLQVKTFFSLKQVKNLLQEKLAIPVEKMTLRKHDGQELENERSLGYYGIELDAMLCLSVV